MPMLPRITLILFAGVFFAACGGIPAIYRFELPTSDAGSAAGRPSTLTITVDNGADTPYNQSYAVSDIEQMSWHQEAIQLDYHYGNAADWTTYARGSEPIITTDATGRPTLDLSVLADTTFHAERIMGGDPPYYHCRSMELATNDDDPATRARPPPVTMTASCRDSYVWSTLPAVTGDLMSYTGPRRLTAATASGARTSEGTCDLPAPLSIGFEVRYLAESHLRPTATTAEHAEYPAVFNELLVEGRRMRARKASVYVRDNVEHYSSAGWSDELSFSFRELPGVIFFDDFELTGAGVSLRETGSHSLHPAPIYPTALTSYAMPTEAGQLSGFDQIAVTLSFTRRSTGAYCHAVALLPPSALALRTVS
jgi:hypothetical protein